MLSLRFSSLFSLLVLPSMVSRIYGQSEVARAPYLQSVSTNSATIVWKTRQVIASEWSLDKPGAVISRGKAAPSRQHTVLLNGLKTGTETRYKVRVDGGRWESVVIRTAPVDGATPIRFAVWGDSGDGSQGQKRLAQRITAYKPQFALHVGDLIYPTGAWQQFDPRFFRIYAPLLREAPFFGSLGNHDVMTSNGAPFLANLVLPRNGPSGVEAERNYWFDWGNIHVVVVDSTASARVMLDKIAPWLERDLKSTKKTWKVVAFHHPPVSSGLHGGYGRVAKYLVPVITRGRADVVFNGHDHNYERFKPRHGVTYIVTGAGGADRYPRCSKAPGSVVFQNSDWSFTAVEVTRRRFSVRQISDSGKVLDNWVLSK